MRIKLLYHKELFWSVLRIHVIVFWIGMTLHNVYAQNYNGLNSSTYAPLENIHTNPAKILDSRREWELNIFSGNFFLNNNHYTTRSVFRILHNIPKYKPSFLQQDHTLKNILEQHIITSTRKSFPDVSNPVNIITSLEYRGPSFYINLGKAIGRKHALAIFTKARLITHLNNFNRNYLFQYHNILQANIPPEEAQNTLDNQRYHFDNLSYLTHAFNEIGLTYGVEIIKKPKYTLSGAITVKHFGGLYYHSLYLKNLYVQFNAPPITTSRSALIKGEGHYTTSEVNIAPNFANPLRLFNHSKIINGNGGWGLDIGLSYAFIPQEADKNITKTDSAIKDSLHNTPPKPLNRCEVNYLFKLSASLMDLGYIRYKNIPLSYDIKLPDNTLIQNWQNRINDIAFISYILNTENGLSVPQRRDHLTIITPTMLNVDVDWHLSSKHWLSKNIFLNAAYHHSIGQYFIRYPNRIANTLWHFFTLSPRYESEDIELSLPLTAFTHQIPQVPFVRLGLALRYKFVFIGTDDILSVTQLASTQSSSLYAGFRYGVNYKCPPPSSHSSYIQDSSGIVSDSLQDRDKDGIADISDKCIDIPGVASNFGCPVDMDSLFAALVKVTSEHNYFKPGDTSINSIQRHFLDTLAIVMASNAKYKILISAEGDTSLHDKQKSDHLAVTRTQQLLEAFVKKGVDTNQLIGVPLRSEQPMGIVPQFRVYYIGKDEDRDGIFDDKDRCPTIPGIITEQGCPLTDMTNDEGYSTALGKKITFWKGFEQFAYFSEKNLDEIANIMTKNVNLKLLIRMFVGNEIQDFNLKEQLAQKRADSVKAYLQRKGIRANRLIALGMSPYEPFGSVPTIKYIKGNEDMDKDMTVDTLDRCPSLKGVNTSQGCPLKDEANVYLRLDSLSRLIKFKEDKDELDISSGKVLFEIINLLKDHPHINVLVSGIVVSNRLSNKQRDALANKRAKNLEEYITNFGIAKNRVVAVGINHQQPPQFVSNIRALASRLSDADGDGVKDYEDKCPTIEGTIANYGCPQVLYEEELLLKDLNNRIAFHPNTSLLIEDAYDALDKLAKLFLRNPHLNFIAYGNVGNNGLSPKRQMQINRERAHKIKNYLIQKGIHKSRITAIGISYLEQNPWLVPNIMIVDLDTDHDADGVQDIYDLCPFTVGSSYNYGCPYNIPKITADVEKISKDILFRIAKYDLDPPSIIALNKFIALLASDTTMRFVVAGNADSTGTKQFNEILSLNRAMSVRHYLIKKGIHPHRIIPIGLGDKFPIGNNKTYRGRQLNRRVDFQLLD